MKRRQVESSAPPRTRGIIVALHTVTLAVVLGTILSCGLWVDKWRQVTYLNKSSLAIYVYTNDEPWGPVMRPEQKLRVLASHNEFPVRPEPQPTTLYAIKAYEFVPGKGNVFGWRDDNGQIVAGGPGDLVFCVTYTWEELKAMNFVITITRNVFPDYHPPDCPL